MEGRRGFFFFFCCCWIWFLLPLKFCRCEWVLVSPLPSPKLSETRGKNELKESFKISSDSDFSCPDFHNLTAMSYSSSSSADEKAPTSIVWEEIPLEEVKEFIKENRKIPKTSLGRKNFVTGIEENLMGEAEKQIKNLFPPGSREARFTTDYKFPSMEGSLMTISMLIFGVYLTKLILRLLQTQSTKYDGRIRSMGESIEIGKNRRERSTIEIDSKRLRLMNLIDEFESKFD